MTPLLLGLLGFGLFRFANFEVHRFELSAERDFAQMLNCPASHVNFRAKVGPEAAFGDVHSVQIRARDFQIQGMPIFVEPKYSRKGQLRSLNLELLGFRMRNLAVNRLTAELKDCRFDFAYAVRHHRLRLTRSGEGIGTVEVDSASLENFILAKYKEVQTVKVDLQRDKLTVEGKGKLFGLLTDFYVVGRVEAVRGTQINLVHARALLNGRVASPSVVQALLKVLNPLIDLDGDLGLDGAAQAQEVAIKDGYLTATGRFLVPQLKDPQSVGH